MSTCENSLNTLVGIGNSNKNELMNVASALSSVKTYTLSSRNYLKSIEDSFAKLEESSTKQLEVNNRILELLGGSRYE